MDSEHQGCEFVKLRGVEAQEGFREICGLEVKY